MYVQWRDTGRWLLTNGLFFLPQPRRKAIDRWLRGREEHRKLQLADYVLMSWGKSGRTWLRVMLSRFYQIAYGMPEGRMLEFDNLQASRIRRSRASSSPTATTCAITPATGPTSGSSTARRS